MSESPKFTAMAVMLAAGVFVLVGCDRDAPGSRTSGKPADPRAVNESALPEPSSTDESSEPLTSTEPADESSSSEVAELEIPADWEYTPYQIQAEADENIFDTLIGYRPNLDITFTNQDGEEVHLATSYRGKTLVITTIYTSCPIPDMCPRLTADIAWLQKNIPRAVRDDVQFLLVSFDPQRDTPEVLKAYGQSHGVKLENAQLLRGTIDETKKLLDREFQIPLEVNPKTNMIVTHAMMLHVVNSDGYIVVERTVNTSEAMDQIAREIALAVKKPFIPPPASSTDNGDEG